MTITSTNIIEETNYYGAHNYHPLPIVVSEANGVWVKDPEGNTYMDMLSAYSAVNQGHRHPKIIEALKNQADRVTLTSRAFHNELLGPWTKRIAKLTKKDKVLPMNTGVEAVETAIKAARRWAYQVKGVTENQAEIIAANGNFHGRSLNAISLSNDPDATKNYGPFVPGINKVNYGDINAIEKAITENTAAIILEPIQGEAGIILPPEGYLEQVRKLCTEKNVLFIADEVQTGFARTGKMFACEWEGVEPDIYVMGKALGGGVLPVSAIAANKAIMDVFTPGSHGSTFGGNPLACAVSMAAIDVIEEENLVTKSLESGKYFADKLRAINFEGIKEVRARGLFIGMEFDQPVRAICENLKDKGILCKETHVNTIRFAPPLVITKKEIDWALQRIEEVVTN
ncbi:MULTISPECIES: ornithine--oxo-acid transaminase [Oceanobacillus]|uniref:Ornithine aminotransferase n=1 Tax=Oceanobacillus kimchii TaxID=746691 RepID=A0ABQ5TJA1_9BACI|nr:MULTISPECIES: ornithine--oxo-acid transaminase [Oceanobacillus]MBT2600712.1 ornithine--oxo-acid transaminase [Oceanobacillus sp. ISL-74]MBT2650891.1 ornithine--oxo-acid transaminase [Oceanobacillus sp. ISL-73]GLO66954.1 ornithine aminotransferase [Oceanobacillus kimchii]